MEHCHPSTVTPHANSQLAGIDPTAAPLHPAPAPDPPRARKPRQSTADYRWTQPKVIAFLEALSRTGRVADAARAVGMSRQAAYDLRARLASPRFDSAFEDARRTGTRARAAASRARLDAARSVWEGPGIAAMAARERGRAEVAQSVTSSLQADTRAGQADGFLAQPDTGAAQVYARPPASRRVFGKAG